MIRLRRLLLPIALAVALASQTASASATTYTATWSRAASGPWLIWEAVAFAPTTGQLVAFGGSGWFSSLKADTWLFNPSTDTWTVLPAQRRGGPSARVHARLAWDPRGLRMLMFGGRTAGGGVLQDTWSFDPRTRQWTGLITSCRKVACPAARWGHGMVWSSALGGLVVFGGSGANDVPFDDTWLFNGTAWTRIAAPVQPSARYLAGMAEDAVTGNILLYGGVSATRTVVPETWMFDPRTRNWTHIAAPTTPEPGAEVGMAWLPSAHAVVVTSGSRPGDCQAVTNSVWAFDTGSGNWIQAATTGGPPTPRTNAYLVTDTVRGSAILLGPPDPNISPEQSDYAWILK